MADRTVRVQLSGNSRSLVNAIDRVGDAATKADAQTKPLENKRFVGKFDADTRNAERKIVQLTRTANKYDNSDYNARFRANTDEVTRAREDADRQLAGIGRTQKRGLLTNQIAQTKKELAELQRFAAKHTPELDLKIDRLFREKEKARRELDKLRKGKVDPEVEFRIKKFEAQRNRIKKSLAEIANARSTPEIRAKTKSFEADLGLVESRLKKLRESRNRPAIDANIGEMERKLDRANAELTRLRSMRVTPEVGAKITELEESLAAAKAGLADIDGEIARAQLEAVDVRLQRRLDNAERRLAEYERKRTAKLDADTAKARTEIIRLDDAADDAARTRIIGMDTMDIAGAIEAANRLRFAADMAARDRRLRLTNDFNKTQQDARELYARMQSMAARSWQVRVDPNFRQAFAEAAALNNRLDDVARNRFANIRINELGDGNAKIAGLNAQLDKFGRTNATATVNIRGDQNVRNRMQMIMGAVMAFAPAVTSASSAAGASLVSLTTILMGGVAVAGAGFAAFKGLGDAISAAGANAMNPTAKSAQTLRDALKDASMETREFVLVLGQYAPLLKQVQTISRAGMFPGMTEGLRAANDALPSLITMIDKASQSLGRMSQATGESIGSPDWQEYFSFLGSTAVPQFESFLSSIGRVVSGFKDLQMAMDPFTKDFVDGFTRMSTEFQRWAEGLESNTAFQDWLQYVRDVGPQVMSTMRSLVEMLGAMGRAMQPIAPVALQIITTFADMITMLLEIPGVGTALMGLVAAIGMLRMAGLLLKATGIAAAFRGIVAGAAAMRAGAGGMAVFSAAAAAAGRNGKAAAGGVTAVGGAAGRAGSQAGKGAAGASKFSGALRGVGGALPIVGVALFGLAAALDANNTSFEEGFDKWQRGGQVAAEYTAELQKNSDMARKNVDEMGPLIGGIFNTASQWVRGADTLESYNQKLQAQKDAMGPVAVAQMEGQRAQTELNEAIARYGPNSEQAATAAGHLAYANARVKLHTELANKVGQDYYTTLGNIAQRNDEAGNAARMLMGGMSGVEVAATGASISIDRTGRAIATLPSGKKVQIDADTKNAAFQLSAVQSQIDTVPPGKTINVGVISGPAQAALRQMGFEVKALPNGTVEVTAKTDDAKNQLRILTQFGEQVRINPKITAEPGVAYNTLLKFINDSNAAAGKPKLEPRTNEANVAVAQMAQGWNNVQGNPKVNPDTTHANAKVGVWKAYAEGLIPTPRINADTRPAHGAAFQWSNATNQLEPVPRVNANSGPGWGVSMRWNDQTSSLEPVPPINADPSRARGESDRWNRDTQGLNPRPRVDADTSGANSAVSSFWNSWNGRVIRMVVNTITGKAGGGPVAPAMADGGPVPRAARGMHVRKTRTLSTGRLAGPGSGTSDSIPLMAANGEWVIRRRIAAIQGAAKMALLNAGKASIVPNAEKFGSAIRASLPTAVRMPSSTSAGSHTRGETNVSNYVTVHNPVAERASDSIQRGLGRMAEMGMFG